MSGKYTDLEEENGEKGKIDFVDMDQEGADVEINSHVPIEKTVLIMFIIYVVFDVVFALFSFFLFCVYGSYFRYYLSSDSEEHEKYQFVTSILGMTFLACSIVFCFCYIFISFFSKFNIMPSFLDDRKGFMWIFLLVVFLIFIILLLCASILMCISNFVGIFFAVVLFLGIFFFGIIHQVMGFYFSFIQQKTPLVHRIRGNHSLVILIMLISSLVVEYSIFGQLFLYTLIKYIYQIVSEPSFPFIYVMVVLYFILFIVTIVLFIGTGIVLKWFFITWAWPLLVCIFLVTEMLIYEHMSKTYERIHDSYVQAFMNVDTFQLIMLLIVCFFWVIPQFVYMKRKRILFFRSKKI